MSGILTIEEHDSDDGFFGTKDGGRRYVVRHKGGFNRAVDRLFIARPELRDWVFRPGGEAPEGLPEDLGIHDFVMIEVQPEASA